MAAHEPVELGESSPGSSTLTMSPSEGVGESGNTYVDDEVLDHAEDNGNEYLDLEADTVPEGNFPSLHKAK